MAEVVVVRWPEEADQIRHLVDAGVPVLYLIDGEHDPPVITSCLEDWVRIPGEERDMRLRVAALEMRAVLHHAPPYVDDSGRMHHGGQTIPLTPVEARLATVLTDRLGSVVSDDQLLDAVTESGVSSSSLKVEVGRLRSHLRGLHLTIRRSRNGYVLFLGE